MRIVIDMQGSQSGSSRTRGIGRYTMALSQAIVHNCGNHEIILALNGLFSDTIEPIRAAFDGLLPQENIRIWDTLGPVDYLNAPKWRRDIAEHIREYFIAHLKPDLVLVTSLFEGLDDNTVTSIGRISRKIPTAVILYDLIPYIYRTPYLVNPIKEKWYLSKLDHLRRADLLLSISESSRQESIDYLGVDKRSVINISTAVDAKFSPRNVPPLRERELRERYGLERRFIMYTGGIDHRKNIEGLIRAYASLPKDIRDHHQLAVVCSIQKHDRQHLVDLASQNGLKTDELILTDFVPEEDLIDLYNLCTAFVFPSWHEGFGLPALEAMSCGAPVIAANTSSLPEVIGWKDALFNPHNDKDIAAKLFQVLTDRAFRQALVHHGVEQKRKFSWDESAKRALGALEQLHIQNEKIRVVANCSAIRPKLAFISPLPPERSGISYYSADLLPELSRYYDIDVVVTQQEVCDPYITAVFPIRTVDWFRKHAYKYDRVLYQFGNSHFHQHMFGLLKEIPGVVVLHDFFLSGVIAHMDVHGLWPSGLAEELYTSHGYEAVRKRFHAKDPADAIWHYPCNLTVLQHAQGIIVHSENSLRLVKQWYSGNDDRRWDVIPLLRLPIQGIDRLDARRALGLREKEFVICSFGIIAPTKLNHRLLNAFLRSKLALDPDVHLVFVGATDGSSYSQELREQIRKSGLGARIHITGWADSDTFTRYLAAADVGVQLRTLSRGETSAAVLDCMKYGLATVANANGSMADLDREAIWMLPDDFSDVQLKEALETLRKDAELRKRLGARAQKVILEKHNPRICAEQYYEAIERLSILAANGTHALSSAMAGFECTLDDRELTNIAEIIARNMPPPLKTQQLLVDVSGLVEYDAKTEVQCTLHGVLRKWLANPPHGIRVEPVYATEDGSYRYARRFTLQLLDCPPILHDDPMEHYAGDIFIGLDLHPQVVAGRQTFQQLRAYGVQVYFVAHDLLSALVPQYFIDSAAESRPRWLEVVTESDGVFSIFKAVADELAI